MTDKIECDNELCGNYGGNGYCTFTEIIKDSNGDCMEEELLEDVRDRFGRLIRPYDWITYLKFIGNDASICTGIVSKVENGIIHTRVSINPNTKDSRLMASRRIVIMRRGFVVDTVEEWLEL